MHSGIDNGHIIHFKICLSCLLYKIDFWFDIFIFYNNNKNNMTPSTFPIYISNMKPPSRSQVVDTDFIIQVFETVWSIGTIERVEFIDRQINNYCIVHINDDLPNHNIIMTDLKNTGKYSLYVSNKVTTTVNKMVVWELSTTIPPLLM